MHYILTPSNLQIEGFTDLYISTKGGIFIAVILAQKRIPWCCHFRSKFEIFVTSSLIDAVLIKMVRMSAESA